MSHRFKRSQQVKNQQSYIPIPVAYLTYPSTAWSTSLGMNIVFHAGPYSIFLEIKRYFRKYLHRMNQSCKCQTQMSKDLQLIEKTWNHTKNRKKGHIFRGDQPAYYLQVFKDSTNHTMTTYKAVDFSRKLFPYILKYWCHRWELPKM